MIEFDITISEKLNRLEKLLRIDESGSILLAVCNSPTLRQKLTYAIQKKVSPEQIYIYQFNVPSDQLNLRQALEDAVNSPGFQQLQKVFSKIAIFVTGLEQFGSRIGEFVKFLDITRNKLFEIGHPVIIWLNGDTVTNVAQGARDFWSRVNIIEFDGGLYPNDIQSPSLEGLNELEEFIEEEIISSIVEEPPISRLFYNLPPRENFFGRENFIEEIMRELSPEDRSFLVSIDGIAGVGKTALAIEVAYCCWEKRLFDSIVWMTAKQKELTLEKIRIKKPMLANLDSLLDTINKVLLLKEDISGCELQEKKEIINEALGSRRCLLIVDNLETLIEDMAIIEFLQKLPSPSKAIITSRRLIREAHPIRLVAMEKEEAFQLMTNEANKRNITLIKPENKKILEKIYGRTGGLPLAMKWVVGWMSKQRVDDVLSRLSQATGSPILDFCFTESIDLLKDYSRKLLGVMPIVELPATQEILSAASGVTGQDLTDGLNELESMSLIDKIEDGRYTILPLTNDFIKKKIEARPKFEQSARMRLAEYYRKQEKQEEVELLYSQVLTSVGGVSQKSKIAGLLTQIGISAYQRGNYMEAEGLFKKAIDVDPNSVFTYHFWGFMERLRSRYGEARRLFKRATEVDPKNVVTWHAWAVMERDLNNFERARELFRKVLEFKPYDVATLISLGVLERRIGNNIKKARELFRKATEVNPKNPMSWQAWAVMESQVGNYEKAEELFKNAFFVRPSDRNQRHQNAVGYHAHSINLSKMEQFDDALRECERGLALEPNNRKLQSQHRWFLRKLGKIPERKDLSNAKEKIKVGT